MIAPGKVYKEETCCKCGFTYEPCHRFFTQKDLEYVEKTLEYNGLKNGDDLCTSCYLKCYGKVRR